MRKIIVFWLPQGRLGNLIFQYQAANALFPKNTLIVSLDVGFLDVIEANPKFKILRIPKLLRSRCVNYLSKFLRWFACKGVIGTVIPEYVSIKGIPVETRKIIRKPGWLPTCWLFEGWFQYDDFSLPAPTIKKFVLDRSEQILAHIPRQQRVAIHMRFGDFAYWEILGEIGVCLPSAYYREAMRRIACQINDPVFVIFSDDIEKAAEMIGNRYPTFYFVGRSAAEDIAGITLCSHAITSASTFSWWGAYCISNSNRIIIAPKYWAGFKSKIWYPLDIESKGFTYIEVE